MIEEFESTYMDKYWNIQMFQWCNYFESANYDLSEVDNEIFNIVKIYHKLIKPTDRKSKIACLLMERDLVDKNPMTAKLRNHIDNLDNYNQGISSEVKKNRYDYKSTLSLRMKNDVLNLMDIRNKLSKEEGFISYPELVLVTEEIDKDNLINLLNKYIEDNLPKALELIKEYNIKWESWFSDLSKISLNINECQPVELINRLLEMLGLDNLKKKIQINYKEQGFSGVASEVSLGDIRIVVEPIHSLSNLKVLFHEIGHAIAYYFNKEKGLYKILPSSYDEAMAVVIEHIASKLLLNNFEQEKMAEIEVLEYTRCAISALYEFELWENPDQAESLYIKHYSKLGFKISNPSIWASDTFRSIDPVYIHNYVIGAVLAEHLTEYLLQKYSCNYKEWGNWLVKNIYVDGRKRPFKEKINEIYNLI